MPSRSCGASIATMNPALRRPMSLDEFLAWERGQELRYEFDGIRPAAMTGGTVEHSVIAANLVRALEDRLRGKPCRAFRGDLNRVKLTEALEAAFAMRLGMAEAAACRTVGDIFHVVRSRFPPSRVGAEGCATAMAFYRVRQALRGSSAQFPLTPNSSIETLAGRRCRKFLEELGRRSGFRTPHWKVTLVGQTGGWMMVAGLIWLLLTAVVAQHLWYTGVAAGGLGLGLALVLLDPGRLPIDCRTLGGLRERSPP